ncbi:hypothetical protein ANN_08531 [Periplaneta americana]|uniref:Uncharacterized protein n=1 Tax=Periplaneta americana TaxID=6978 RepID=A0ABQ8T394_PERAM|nr:hypothetical protein ANN_08531 [Periplaneta americana]
MAGLCEGGNDPASSLKAIHLNTIDLTRDRTHFGHRSIIELQSWKGIANGVSDSQSEVREKGLVRIYVVCKGWFTINRELKRQRERERKYIYFNIISVVFITEDVQNVHLLLEYRPHIDVSLTCKHDPKLQEYCVCPQNMPQFHSEGIPNQAPETNKPMILNGPTSRNREGSDQVSVEAKQLGHLYLSIDQETFDPSTGEPYD